MKANNYICLEEITRRYGLSKSAVYNWIRLHAFPKPYKFGHSSVWGDAELKAWFGKRALAGEPLPKLRRKRGKQGQRVQQAAVVAPKPRLYKLRGMWRIDNGDSHVFVGLTPRQVYDLWRNRVAA